MPKMTARPRARRRALEGIELLRAAAALAGSPVGWHSPPPCHPAERAEVQRRARLWVTHRETLLAHDPDGAWWRSIEAGTDPAFEADPGSLRITSPSSSATTNR